MVQVNTSWNLDTDEKLLQSSKKRDEPGPSSHLIFLSTKNETSGNTIESKTRISIEFTQLDIRQMLLCVVFTFPKIKEIVVMLRFWISLNQT